MGHVSTQGIDDCMINVQYYYYYCIILCLQDKSTQHVGEDTTVTLLSPQPPPPLPTHPNIFNSKSISTHTHSMLNFKSTSISTCTRSMLNFKSTSISTHTWSMLNFNATSILIHTQSVLNFKSTFISTHTQSMLNFKTTSISPHTQSMVNFSNTYPIHLNLNNTYPIHVELQQHIPNPFWTSTTHTQSTLNFNNTYPIHVELAVQPGLRREARHVQVGLHQTDQIIAVVQEGGQTHIVFWKSQPGQWQGHRYQSPWYNRNGCLDVKCPITYWLHRHHNCTTALYRTSTTVSCFPVYNKRIFTYLREPF